MPVACGNEFSQAVAPWKFTSHHQTWVRTWGTYPNRPFQSKPVPARFAWFTISGGTLSVFPFIPLRGIISQAWVDKLPGHLTETRTPISTLKGWPPSQLEDETIIIFFIGHDDGNRTRIFGETVRNNSLYTTSRCMGIFKSYPGPNTKKRKTTQNTTSMYWWPHGGSNSDYELERLAS